MKAIWKYPFEVDGEIILQVPKGAEPLCVQVQDDKPCLWMVVNPDAYLENRKFRIIATGQPFDNSSNRVFDYVGTFQLVEGRFIGHLFDIGSDG